MPNHLESKTMAGLLLIIGVAAVASVFGKLTPELVDVLKWVGGSFMAMRAAANVAENLPGRKDG